MNQTLISNVGNKRVFLISDDKIPYYISIPSEETATIVINLIDNPDIINTAKANMAEIPNKITEIYNNFNQENIAVVTPIIDSAIMNGVKTNADPKYISFLNQAIGHIINKSYMTLKQNGKSVYQKIKLNNNETYSIFNNKFSSMYPDRIELANYKENKANTFATGTNIPTTPIAPVEETLANTTSISLEDAYKEENEEQSLEQGKERKLERTREPGFVSYVLLGVIVAVLSLIGLYLLL